MKLLNSLISYVVLDSQQYLMKISFYAVLSKKNGNLKLPD